MPYNRNKDKKRARMILIIICSIAIAVIAFIVFRQIGIFQTNNNIYNQNNNNNYIIDNKNNIISFEATNENNLSSEIDINTSNDIDTQSQEITRTDIAKNQGNDSTSSQANTQQPTQTTIDELPAISNDTSQAVTNVLVSGNIDSTAIDYDVANGTFILHPKTQYANVLSKNATEAKEIYSWVMSSVDQSTLRSTDVVTDDDGTYQYLTRTYVGTMLDGNRFDMTADLIVKKATEQLVFLNMTSAYETEQTPSGMSNRTNLLAR